MILHDDKKVIQKSDKDETSDRYMPIQHYFLLHHLTISHTSQLWSCAGTNFGFVDLKFVKFHEETDRKSFNLLNCNHCTHEVNPHQKKPTVFTKVYPTNLLF